MKCFRFAIAGLIAAIKSERNLRFHLAAAFYVLIAAAITGANAYEWCILLMCIDAVLAAELFNTAIERLCDETNPGYSAKIKFVKDVAAGAVLVFATGSAVAGGIIFFSAEKLTRALDFAKSNPIIAVLLVATVPAAIYFIFHKSKKLSQPDA